MSVKQFKCKLGQRIHLLGPLSLLPEFPADLRPNFHEETCFLVSGYI